MVLAEYTTTIKAQVLVTYRYAGYFDESEDSDILVLAGVFAPVHHWLPFENAWQALIDEYQISEFHMQECENRKGLWETWTNPADRWAVQQRFIDLFVQNPYPSPAGFAVGVDLTTFASTVGPRIRARHPQKGYDKPWLFAFVHVLDRMMMAQRNANFQLGADEHLELFFDKKDEFAGKVNKIVQVIKQNIPLCPIGAVVFDDSRNQPALQTADMVAYEARRSLTETVLPEEPVREIRQQWRQLMHSKLPGGQRRICAESWDAAALQRNIDAVDEDSEPGSILVVEDDAGVRWLTGRGYSAP
jgi:hypothetical protein